ncbi:protein of unknown function DUF4419 [Catovirus CTV1]|uniref:Uncharacterized protein n=1 Tax=Catovirus CTV1 TaxID=1977631 RepID=A0A1V0S8X8_9VIRU|nr:protein of unknown function DUF4419 [Catovirus CTV1]
MAQYCNIIKVNQLNPVNPKHFESYSNMEFDDNSIFNMVNDNIDPKNTIINDKFCNKFIGTYHTCYICHGNAVFSPSDLWIVVCLSFSKYASENIDETKKFINTPSQDIMVDVDSNKPDWIDAIEKTVSQINILDNNLKNILENDFLCATVCEKIACKIAVMKTVEHFTTFQYAGMCGFNHIKLLGSKEDWIKLKNKSELLKNYGNDKWKEYMEIVITIFNKFVESFDQPDIVFFNEMIHNDYDLGLYADRSDIISGWILKLFYGFEDEYKLCEVPDLYASVDATLHTNSTKKIYIKTQFIGSYITTNDSEFNKTNMRYIKIKDNGYYVAKYVDDCDTPEDYYDSDYENNYGYKLSDNSKVCDTVQNIYDFRPVIYCGIYE